MSEPTSRSESEGSSARRRFEGLRGVQWRLDLGVLPAAPSSSIDDLRRATADTRRRYASLRRRLLVDPHISKDGSNSPDLALDNPLSQNPDSSWGRFFRNAELEKMVDQDLLRLYPEDGSYFQTPGCQGMLRRILLLWCLRHPEYGYRQGMHELLAPLVYVLHVDLERLSQVRELYEEHFTDKFDELSFHDNDLTYNFDFKKFSDTLENGNFQGNASKVRSITELDPEIQKIILLSDAYGAEGELGIVLSEKFMEHDAYCMFDALMSGVDGSVAMADFFAHSTACGSNAGLPPVIEASAALYHLLSAVDSSLHSHLIELGVEPQYFALRWLRVLFGREFALKDLLAIWDEIFAQDNRKMDITTEDDEGSSFRILSSSRGVFIAGIAVSMILHLRSSLLAAENATSCLQRLLSFPQNVDLANLIEKARSLQVLALEVNTSTTSSSSGAFVQSKRMVSRGHSLSSDSISPKTPFNLVPDSYWEEMWRNLHKEEELKRGSLQKQVSTRKKGWSEKVKLSLSRTESDPSPAKAENIKKVTRTSVRRNLLEDLSQQLGSDEGAEATSSHQNGGQKHQYSVKDNLARSEVHNEFSCADEERRLSANCGSEENSSIFSDPVSPLSGPIDHDSEKSSVVSNLSLDECEDQLQSTGCTVEDSPLPVSDVPDNTTLKSEPNNDPAGKAAVGVKERRPLSGKFQWLWKLGRNASAEETSDKEGAPETSKSTDAETIHHNAAECSVIDHSIPSGVSKGDSIDGNVIGTLRNLGQSMIEHIQVIESVFQQDRGQVASLENYSKNLLVGKGQVTAMTALKELRKISSLLSEM
ncbi:uncharacterized protein LOC115744600 [Rhodamnia argentea]|uniref:Uncharacterized protein LOC115744600 n=1 Tax=Rhodamnia argentea TaxID=178133 RepID=A0ABM3H9V3_9MYRT|nr:uncharacterized protein LOC115744600 [Rhodamnia argentea]